MNVARTFWEKATAAHVYCAQGRIRGERYARHWHDLAAIMRSAHFGTAIDDRAVARAVAEHKSCFFSEKDAGGEVIDYASAVQGALQIVPEGAAREALAILQREGRRRRGHRLRQCSARCLADRARRRCPGSACHRLRQDARGRSHGRQRPALR
ncbi:nucleotidyl transferase AbiEii/AbiGii toxin family protein [Variovorax sp. Root411]|uniref:nucleotidyl transferase AbiEii/AbiGii toxin family protein n=1 Tax=Variovorax sp. Root411 TaxID=1736530 RepID=UPI0009E80A19|nr:nucleotidyl transferase AbiEii/AbiGii toxin family protein [Variovorax sp. Root411]